MRGVAQGCWVGGWDKAWEKEHNIWSMAQTSLQKHQANETDLVNGKMAVGVRKKE